MRRIIRVVTTAGVAVAACAGLLAGEVPAASASTLGNLVFVVKDQTGGAYYNVTTGARYDVVAATAAPTLAVAAVQAADGVVLATDGELFAPLGTTPADSVATVVENDVNGTLVDQSTGVEYNISGVGGDLQTGYMYALELTTGMILGVNNHVLLPVQRATGLTYGH